MSGDGSPFEYPDEAGYPDGMGTLHEGTEEADDDVEPEDGVGSEDDIGSEVDAFAMQDEEDVDGD